MQHFSRTLLALSVALLSADSFAGDIRQVSCNSGCGEVNCTSEGCNSNRCKDPRCRSRRVRKGDYCDAGDCKNGRCGVRGTARDFVLDWAGSCSPAGRLARRGCPLAQKAVWCCKTKAYPDSGWAPPARVPMTRSGGAYSANWSNGFSGGYGPGAPMVYQPTDTTQLGYSYGNVPTWRPSPGMIPPVPNPSNFHNRICPPSRCGGCSTSCGGCMSYGNVIYGDDMGGSCESCDMGYISMRQPNYASQMAAAYGVRPTTVRTQPNVAVKTAQPKTVQVAQTTTKPGPAKVQLASKTVAVTPKPAVAQKPVVKKPQAKQVQPQRRTTQRPGKRTARPKQKSQGWFGLPSLSEVKL